MTDTIHLVHTADWHLGSPFRAYPERSSQLRQEQLAVFSRFIDDCALEKPDVLLIAGDLFDQPVPAADLVNLVRDQLDSLCDTQVFIAAGNHDPAFIDSPYRTVTWPAHVHCFSDDLAFIDLPGKPVRVMGAGFTAAAATRSLLPAVADPAHSGFSSYPSTGPKPVDRLCLLVLHADLVGNGQGSAYNPVTVDQIAGLGIDYAALGHRHERSGPLSAGHFHYAYSGCPLGRGFDETGEKGILRLDFSFDPSGPRERAKMTQVDWKCLEARRFTIQSIPVDTVGAADDLACFIRSEMVRLHGEDWVRMACRILLTGRVPDDRMIVPSLLTTRVAPDAFWLEMADRTSRIPDVASLREENSLRGAFVRLLDRPDADDRDRLALELGLMAFSGEVPERAYP